MHIVFDINQSNTFEVILLRKILISGFYGFYHIGDDAILQSLIEQFRCSSKEICITVLSANPEYTKRLYNVDAVDRWNFYEVLKAVKNCDILISGGGSLLQDETSQLGIWYYLGIILSAFFCKKSVYIFAQGIGPVNNIISRVSLKLILNKTMAIWVRDRRPYEMLKKLGVSKQIKITADPAFLLTPLYMEQAQKILKNESCWQSLDKPMIGMSIRKWKGNVDVAAIFATAADKIARDLDVRIVLIPFHSDEDYELAQEISSKMTFKPAIISSSSYMPSEILGISGLMSMNISIRLHGLIFSSLMGVPVIGISYDPKIDGFMSALGIDPLCRYENLSSDLLVNEIKYTWERKDELKKIIADKTEELSKISLQGIHEILHHINNLTTN